MANNFGRVNVSISASTGALTAGLSRARKQLSGFQSSVGGMSGAFSALRGSMGTLLPVFGAFTTAAGAIAALTSATRAAEALHNLSQELSVAPGNLQVLTQVAGEFGVSQEAMTGALRRSTRMVSELAAGTPSAVKAFQVLGLTMQDLAGLDSAEQFRLIAERIAALPPQMQAAAAIDIFGRSGQGLLNFIRQGSAAVGEMDTLLTQLGVKMTTEQVAAIESMGDAIGRLTLPMQGFINQFLAGVAPAITAVSEILMEFFTSSNQGFSYAKMFADLFVGSLKAAVVIGSVLVGTFQIFKGVILGIGAAATIAFGFIVEGVGNVLGALGRVVPALRSVGASVSRFGQETQSFGDALGQEAADSFTAAIANFENPLQDFDRRMREAQGNATQAAMPQMQSAAQAAGESIAAAIGASTKELNAVVVGSSEGEALRNSILRGADPRLEGGNEAKRTADATERTADGIEDLAANMQGGGFGQAQIAMA